MSKKKISQQDMKKMMSNMKRDKTKKRRIENDYGSKTTTNDVIALKKIKLLKEGKLTPSSKKSSTLSPKVSSLASKVNFNADKMNPRAHVLEEAPEPKTVPENFFDDEKEAEEKMDQMETDLFVKPPTEERKNKRLLQQKKGGPKVKGIGVATNLPQGFFDDKTKDANVRGVETPADKETREWTEFTDAMNEELVKSHQMLEEDDESGNLAKDIVEVDLQLSLFSKTKTLAERAAEFRGKREELRQELTAPAEDMSDDSDGEIDWRQQNIF